MAERQLDRAESAGHLFLGRLILAEVIEECLDRHSCTKERRNPTKNLQISCDDALERTLSRTNTGIGQELAERGSLRKLAVLIRRKGSVSTTAVHYYF